MATVKIRLTINDPTFKTDREHTRELPGRYSVCPRCDGSGTHVNPAIDGNGITADEWERDWDEDSREAYLTGRYDVTCEECRGLRVLPEADVALMTSSQRRFYRFWQRQQADKARDQAEYDNELRWGY